MAIRLLFFFVLCSQAIGGLICAQESSSIALEKLPYGNQQILRALARKPSSFTSIIDDEQDRQNVEAIIKGGAVSGNFRVVAEFSAASVPTSSIRGVRFLSFQTPSAASTFSVDHKGVLPGDIVLIRNVARTTPMVWQKNASKANVSQLWYNNLSSTHVKKSLLSSNSYPPLLNSKLRSAIEDGGNSSDTINIKNSKGKGEQGNFYLPIKSWQSKNSTVAVVRYLSFPRLALRLHVLPAFYTQFTVEQPRTLREFYESINSEGAYGGLSFRQGRRLALSSIAQRLNIQREKDGQTLLPLDSIKIAPKDENAFEVCVYNIHDSKLTQRTKMIGKTEYMQSLDVYLQIAILLPQWKPKDSGKLGRSIKETDRYISELEDKHERIHEKIFVHYFKKLAQLDGKIVTAAQIAIAFEAVTKNMDAQSKRFDEITKNGTFITNELTQSMLQSLKDLESELGMQINPISRLDTSIVD